MKISLKFLLIFVISLTSTLTSASHFRGGAANASVDANGMLTLSQTSFWRKAWASASTHFTVTGVGSAVTSNSINISDARFDVSTGTAAIQLPGAGLYTYIYSSCCRVGGGVNFTTGDFDVEGAIFWDGSTANAPILFDFASISNEVFAGSDYNQNLNAVGIGLTYDQLLNTGINSQPPGFTVNATTGQMNIPAASTATWTENNANGADYAFSGNIKATDGSFTQYDWVFDLVTQSSNLAPNITDIVINGLVGGTFNGTITGADPEGNTLSWFVQSLLGAGMNLANFTFNAATQAFSFDSSGLTAGTYIANIGASDGALNGFGSITFNLRDGSTGQIPEPSAILLFGLAAGLLVRTRKAK